MNFERIFLILMAITFLSFFYIIKNNSLGFTNSINAHYKNVRNVYIDLGANKGDSIYNFFGLMNAQGGEIGLQSEIFPESFRNQKWIVYAFEANKFFDDQLINMSNTIASMGHTVHLYRQTAAWTKDGTIDFYLDTINIDVDFWGSSLKKDHIDVVDSNQVKTVVRCVDIAKIIKEYRETDNIVVKMDIEGAEYDLLQDFIRKDVIKLIDFMAIEYHSFVSPFTKPADVFISLFQLFGVKVLPWS